MTRTNGFAIGLGPLLFGLTMAAFGIQCLIYADGVFGLAAMPHWLLAPRAWAYLNGLVLVAAGVGLAVGKLTGLAAAAVAVVLTAWLLLLQLPHLLAAPHNGGAWTTACETLALSGAAWALAGPPIAARLGRLSYAASLFVFCILHFVYRDYVASVIPGWIPSHYAWTYATAVAFAAAGVSLITGVWDRWAATLLGVMFGTWVLILHAPRAVAAVHSRPEWTSLFIALGMCGGAWILAARARR
jgi:hypothetical protein